MSISKRDGCSADASSSRKGPANDAATGDAGPKRAEDVPPHVGHDLKQIALARGVGSEDTGGGKHAHRRSSLAPRNVEDVLLLGHRGGEH